MKNAIIIYTCMLASVLALMAITLGIAPCVYEDKLTGCQYIQTMFTMTPRIDSDGDPVCIEDVLK